MGSSRKGIPHVVVWKKTKVCPYCGKSFKSLGMATHRAACMKKKQFLEGVKTNNQIIK